MTTDSERSESSDSRSGDPTEMPLIQLCGLVEDLSYGISALKTETVMFEKYYNKLDPRDQKYPRLSEIKMTGQDYAQFRTRRQSRSRPDRTIGLTIEQKCQMMQRELEDTKETIRHMRANAERDLQYHEAIIEEAEIRWAEVQKAMSDFEKDILTTISKKKGSILATQKVMKYIEDMNRRRDDMKDKLRLKNVSLKVQKKKMLLQLRQKEEVGDALHEVDFQQLKIENAQFLEIIETKNSELVQLKLVSGNALHILSMHKSRLHQALELSSQLDKEIQLRNELLKKVEKESIQAEELLNGLDPKDSETNLETQRLLSEMCLDPAGRAKAETINKKLRKQLAEFRAPPVMMYVQEKIRNGDLEKTIKMWERKVEIAELSLKGYRKVWNQMKTANEYLQVASSLGNSPREVSEDSLKVIH